MKKVIAKGRLGYALSAGAMLIANAGWAQSGITNLGTLNNGSSSFALGVNADGSVVVGQAIAPAL